MAYSYETTRQALGLLNQDEDQAGTTLASDEGAVVGTSQQTLPNPQAPQAVSPPTAGGKNKVMERNAGRSQAPTDLSRINQQIGSSRQNLQNEANAYVQGADDETENISNDTIRSGLQARAQGQPKTDKDKWIDFFQQGTAGRVKGPEFKTDTTDVKDVNLLKDDAGIRQLFQRRQDPEGTLGEAALDTALLRKNQDFNIARDAAVTDYEALQKEKQALGLTAQEKAQAVADKGLVDFKGRVGGIGQDLLRGIDQQAAESEAAFDSQIEAARVAREEEIKRAAEQKFFEFISSGRYSPDVSSQLQLTENLDPYFTKATGAEGTNADDFYSEDQANQWNNLKSLLGIGGPVRSAGKLAGKSVQDYVGPATLNDSFADQMIAEATTRAEAKRKADDEATQKANDKAASKKRGEDITQAQYDQMDREFAERQAARESEENKEDEADMIARLGSPLASYGGYENEPVRKNAAKGTREGIKAVKRLLGR